MLTFMGCTKPKTELNSMEKFFDCLGSGNCEAFKKNSVKEQSQRTLNSNNKGELNNV